MSKLKQIVKEWFSKWESGDFLSLPIGEEFEHTSPFGMISGKEQYLELVELNKSKFLGYKFKIHDEIYARKTACVRYTATQDDFRLDVSEWYYFGDGVINEIVAYYHIGEVREDRKLSSGDTF